MLYVDERGDVAVLGLRSPLPFTGSQLNEPGSRIPLKLRAGVMTNGERLKRLKRLKEGTGAHGPQSSLEIPRSRCLKAGLSLIGQSRS